jgi:hypothetical protein
MLGVQKAIGASSDCLLLKAVTIAGKIDTALIVDVGSLEDRINCLLKSVRQDILLKNWID